MVENASAIKDEQRRLTYLTRYYFELQGIRIAPLWVAVLCLVFELRYLPAKCDCLGWGVLWWALGALAFVALWYWLVDRYYRSRFGRLQPATMTLPGGSVFRILLLCLVAFMLYCLVVGSQAFIPLLVIFFEIRPLLDAENPRIRRAYYAVGGALIAAAALLPEHSHRDVVRNGTIFLVTLSVVALALGIADHLLLMSLRGPVREGADG